MTLLCEEEKSLPTQMDFYNLFMVTHTIPFLTNFPHLEKFADLIKDLNMNTKAFFPCGGGSNLI